MNRKPGMNNLLTIIRDILNREDIEGFLALGAPQDEYSAEAEVIRQAIENGQVKLREEELNEFLIRTWEKMFGPFSEEELRRRRTSLQKVAKQLAGACSHDSSL